MVEEDDRSAVSSVDSEVALQFQPGGRERAQWGHWDSVLVVVVTAVVH